MKIKTLGIDLAKSIFHLVGADERGEVKLRKRLRRKQVLAFLANLEPCLVGLEACGGSNYWAREIAKLGHDVRLISPQFVKPYVKGNKNDYNDAQGLCEAVSRPTMRFVPIKTVEQQDVQTLHRIRQSRVKARTALVNQIRGLLGEYGIVVVQGINAVRTQVPEILEDGENGLTDRFRRWLSEQYTHLQRLDEQVKNYEKEIEQLYQESEVCRRIGAVEGIGPLGATAIVSAYGEAREYKNGRQFAASLGLVPRQHTTGGKPMLLGISKRGDSYIRSLLIHGARAVVRRVENKEDSRSRWIQRLVMTRGKNKAAVALANKNARIIWALLSRQEVYRPAVHKVSARPRS
jgi:transposase